MSTTGRTRAELLLLAEVALAVMSVASVLSLRRVFDSGSFLPATISAVLLAHLLAALLRRSRLPQAAIAVVGVAGAVLFVTWVRLRATTTLGVLPTPDTLTLAREQIREAIEVFGEVTPPAKVLPGFVLMACLGAWMMAVTADLAAFRARAQLEAIIPATTLFVFGGALGSGGGRLGVAALFIGATLVHWLAQRALAAASSPTWLASERGGTASPLLRVGAVLVAVGVLAAIAVGPRLPGARAEAVVPWRAEDREQPNSRVTVSPLVDIRTRLVDQSSVVAFRVRSEQRAYWRLTSLEEFNGQQWTSSGEYERADGELGSDVDPSEAHFRSMQASFEIFALAQFWLPAPFRPVRIDGTAARYDTDSNSLVTEEETASGLEYTVTAAVPEITREDLEQVAPIAPGFISDEYTRLPAGFSNRVQELAGKIIRGADTQYERAMALQNYLRSSEFTYDLNVRSGHGEDALEQFLFDARRGYCEQFAGAYAAMARAVGLPARVAVGFTPGEIDPRTKEYVVRGLNGHAWPEVYLNGYGWVAFEPTPGRGMPGAQSYTEVPEAQASIDDPNTPTTLPGREPAPGASTSTTSAPSLTTTTAAPAAGQTPPGDTSERTGWVGPWALVLLLVAGLAGLWIAGVTALRVLTRRRRRKAATTPGARVLVAWSEASEALARAGAPRNPWETPHEFAIRAAGTTGVDPRLLLGLAGVTTRVVYGAGDVTVEVADQAAGVAATVATETGAQLARRTRLRLLVDPRPLLPDRRRHVDVQHR
jgi:transglutaminase-like putative cysteine protease